MQNWRCGISTVELTLRKKGLRAGKTVLYFWHPNLACIAQVMCRFPVYDGNCRVIFQYVARIDGGAHGSLSGFGRNG